ncbi:thermonuclease family protein [Mesorhizobium sp.]|uniref:thermonuclease family protein n=1 Tax=Mesorhizobium sp. TaxID=1871066 RepID=UPI00345829CA
MTWDRYGRIVGTCTRADGTDVAAWMVEQGQALDWPKYSNGGYAAQQGKAQAAKLGLWVGNFQTPWDWRVQHSDDVQVPSTPVSPSATPAATSRATFRQTGNASIMCPDRNITASPSSAKPRAKGGSAQKRKQWQPAGGVRSDSALGHRFGRVASDAPS